MKIVILIISAFLFLPTATSYATAISDAVVTMDVSSLSFGGINVYFYNKWWEGESELSTSAHSESSDGKFDTDNDKTIHKYTKFIALEDGELNFSVNGHVEASASGGTSDDTAWASASFYAFIDQYKFISKEHIINNEFTDSVGYITSLQIDVSGVGSKSGSEDAGGSGEGLNFQEGQEGYFSVMLDPVTEAKGFVPAPLPIILLGTGLIGIVVFRKLAAMLTWTI